MDDLPQELIDEVIGIVALISSQNSLDVLHSCSLVCRSWRQPAQKHLFLRVSIRDMRHLRKWHSTFSPGSVIPSYVRHLYWGISHKTSKEEGGLFSEEIFPGRFASFSNLEILWLTGSFPLILFDTSTIQRAFGHIGHSLHSLRIISLRTDRERFCFLISLLPNLRTLDTPGATIIEREGSRSNPRHFNFTGRIVTPYCDTTEQFFRSIAGLNPRLESLQARTITPQLVDNFNLLMRSCSATLTTLSISTQTVDPLAIKAMTQWDLSSCVNLRTFTVDSYFVWYPEFNSLLHNISSRHLERFILCGNVNRVPPDSLNESDHYFRSFAERLYDLGAPKPLTVVLTFRLAHEHWDRLIADKRVLPSFCEVGVVVKEDDPSWSDSWDIWQGGTWNPRRAAIPILEKSEALARLRNRGGLFG